MKFLDRIPKDDLVGIHLALNVFVGTAVIWLLVTTIGGLNPIWAISSMVASVDPHVKLAFSNFKARLTNALLGCVVGLLFLLVGGEGDWKLPFALAVTALLSSYIVRVPVMWRQAPITAALVLASGFEKHSKLSGLEIGLRRVGEVILGCIVGFAVTWVISKIWPLHETPKDDAPAKV